MVETIHQLFDLTGKVAIVTGASRGLGQSMAKALAQAGADVVLAARTMARLEELAQSIEQCGRKALPLRCDVGRYEEVQRMVEIAIGTMKKVDILLD